MGARFLFNSLYCFRFSFRYHHLGGISTWLHKMGHNTRGRATKVITIGRGGGKNSFFALWKSCCFVFCLFAFFLLFGLSYALFLAAVVLFSRAYRLGFPCSATPALSSSQPPFVCFLTTLSLQDFFSAPSGFLTDPTGRSTCIGLLYWYDFFYWCCHCLPPAGPELFSLSFLAKRCVRACYLFWSGVRYEASPPLDGVTDGQMGGFISPRRDHYERAG